MQSSDALPSMGGPGDLAHSGPAQVLTILGLSVPAQVCTPAVVLLLYQACLGRPSPQGLDSGLHLCRYDCTCLSGFEENASGFVSAFQFATETQQTIGALCRLPASKACMCKMLKSLWRWLWP